MREAVAVDFMGVGQAAGGGSPPDGGSEERVRLVRPIPSGGQARRSPAPEGGREGAHPFASQGLHGESVASPPSPTWQSLGFTCLHFEEVCIRGGWTC
jgi:hypothetical protein